LTKIKAGLHVGGKTRHQNAGVKNVNARSSVLLIESKSTMSLFLKFVGQRIGLS